MTISSNDVAQMIDHSLLHPTVSNQQLENGCQIARKYKVASVCVKPHHVALAAHYLNGSNVAVGTVCGFPHGNSLTAVKNKEAREAICQGASEIDMVVNIGAVLSEEWELIKKEISILTESVHEQNGLIKVIFENCYLEDFHKIELCRICDNIGVDWIKTSTGFGQKEGRFYGATDDDLILMRSHITKKVQLKAAGGIKNLDRLLEVRALGCTRVGATATETIMNEAIRTL